MNASTFFGAAPKPPQQTLVMDARNITVTLTMSLAQVSALHIAIHHETRWYAENGFRPDQYAELTEAKDALATVFVKALRTARTEATQ